MPGLKHLVRCGWVHEVGGGTVQRVIPDNCADILVTAGGDAYVVGTPTRVELPGFDAGTVIHGLRIAPYAVRTVFGLDAAELTDRTLPLDAVLGDREARAVADAVRSDPARLGARWRDARPDRAAVGIVRALIERAPLDAVAHDAGYSGRHLRRLVRTETGLSPKTLQRVARLHEFLRRAAAAPVAVAAAGAGYADQPHATREIRALTGLTPRALIAERITPDAGTGGRSVGRSSP